MLGKITLILLGVLLITNGSIAAQDAPPLSAYSRFKYFRSLVPIKSEFETESDYQQKISSWNLSLPSIDLELLPHRGKYDPNQQQLHIHFDTVVRHFGEYSGFPQADKKLARRKLFDDSDRAILLNYRLDSAQTEQKLVGCRNIYRPEAEYTHRVYRRHQYAVNTLGQNLDISLNMPPQVAKKYFTEGGGSLNERLVLKLILKPVLPFYSFYTSHRYSDCPESYEERVRVYRDGIHESSFNYNHLIHADVVSLQLIDRQTSELIYSDSFIP